MQPAFAGTIELGSALAVQPDGTLVAVTFRTTITGFEGTITAEAVLATATADRTVVDHRRTVEVLTSRLETE